jgi:hypothetical protein
MPIPVINQQSGYLGFSQHAGWEYQPFATNTPTSWSSSALPPGVSLDAPTGKLSGPCTVAGAYNVTLFATNADGTSEGVTFFLAIEPAGSGVADGIVDYDLDIETGRLTLAGSGSTGTGNGSDGEVPTIVMRQDDDLLMRIAFRKGGVALDLPITAMAIAVKEFEPETVLFESTTFGEIGTGSDTRFLLHAKAAGNLLEGVLSNYEADATTAFNARAEIEWIMTNETGVGPAELRRSTRDFLIRIERDYVQ